MLITTLRWFSQQCLSFVGKAPLPTAPSTSQGHYVLVIPLRSIIFSISIPIIISPVPCRPLQDHQIIAHIKCGYSEVFPAPFAYLTTINFNMNSEQPNQHSTMDDFSMSIKNEYSNSFFSRSERALLSHRISTDAGFDGIQECLRRLSSTSMFQWMNEWTHPATHTNQWLTEYPQTDGQTDIRAYKLNGWNWNWMYLANNQLLLNGGGTTQQNVGNNARDIYNLYKPKPYVWGDIRFGMNAGICYLGF